MVPQPVGPREISVRLGLLSGQKEGCLRPALTSIALRVFEQFAGADTAQLVLAHG